MNRIEVEYVEDSSELDPQAPGVWTQGSFHLDDSGAAPADAPAIQIHVRTQRRPHRMLRLSRVVRSWCRREGRQGPRADSLS